MEDLEDEEFKTSYMSEEWGKIIYRSGLQIIGTDLFRDKFHPNTWCNALFADYVSTKDLNTAYAKAYPDNMLPLSKWIITDVRFLNEIEAIKDREGIVIRVNRLKTSEEWYKEINEKKDVVKILDPDGWDRSNYDFSWKEEKISMEDFYDRLVGSTCSFGIDHSKWEKSAFHKSEVTLDISNEFHFTIINNGTVEELIEKVKEILIKLELI